MLLWHDGLAYRSEHYFGEQYPGYTGSPAMQDPHEDYGRFSMSGNFNFSTPVLTNRPVEFGVENCILGMLMRVGNGVPVNTDFFDILTVAGTSLQVRTKLIRIAPNYTHFFLQFELGDFEQILLQTPAILHDEWVFLEVLTKIDLSQGKIIVRINGTEIARAENLTTETSVSNRDWDAVSFTNGFGVDTSWADLYICDGRSDEGKSFSSFLGKTTSSKINAEASPTELDAPPILPPRVAAISTDWVHSVAEPLKHRLVVLAGQSNMAGRTTATTSSTWRNPNNTIEIFDTITIAAPGAFAPLRASVNTDGMLELPFPATPFSGPEMRFAERAAVFYETSGITDQPHTWIIKGTRDASWIFPGAPVNFCWHPAIANNLWNGTGASPRGVLLTNILAAVTEIGGWNKIERVDFFWYQGESESIHSLLTALYQVWLDELFTQIRIDLPSAPLHFHVVQLHKDHERGPGPDSGGLWGVPFIRNQQKAFCERNDDCTLLNIDQAEMQSFGLHLTPKGYDTVGDLVFDRWLEHQFFAEPIADYNTIDIEDPYYVATSPAAAPEPTILFPPGGSRQIGNSPLLSVASQMHALADPIDTLSITPICGGRSFVSDLQNTLIYTNRRQITPGVSLPETLISNVGMKI